MFHYRVFGGLKAIFAAAEVAICCILLTNCCRRISRVKTVADCSQTVCNLLQPIKILGLGIPTRLRHSRQRLGDQRCNKWARAALPGGGRTRSVLRSPAASLGFRPVIRILQVTAGSELWSNSRAVPLSTLYFSALSGAFGRSGSFEQRDRPKLLLLFP
jgi:hypothetical protein